MRFLWLFVVCVGVVWGANLVEVRKARREFEDAFSKYGKLLKKRRPKAAELRKAAAKLKAAIRKLASFNDPKAVKVLLTKCLNHKKFWVVRYTYEAVKANTTSEAAQDEVARFAMRQRDENLRYVLARMCVGWKSQQVGRFFERLADGRGWRLKVLAAKGLAFFKTGSAKGRLERLLRDRHLSVRLAAAASLLTLGYPKEKIPKPLRETPFVDGPFLPKRILTQRLIIMIDASNPMNTKMALTQDEIAERLKELQKRRKQERRSKGDKKKQQTQDKEEFYKQHFVVTRFDFAKLKVRKLIQSLPKEMDVRLLFVSGGVEEFGRKGEAIRLSDKDTLKEFWQWYERRTTYPGRDLVTAFKRAFDDPLADTVILITCGGPDKSEIDDYEEFLRWFRQRNFYRGLQVHVAELVADFGAAGLTRPEQVARQERIDRITSFLSRLAQAGEGRFTAVSHTGKVALPSGTPKKKPTEKEKAQKGSSKAAPKEEKRK